MKRCAHWVRQFAPKICRERWAIALKRKFLAITDSGNGSRSRFNFMRMRPKSPLYSHEEIISLNFEVWNSNEAKPQSQFTFDDRCRSFWNDQNVNDLSQRKLMHEMRRNATDFISRTKSSFKLHNNLKSRTASDGLEQTRAGSRSLEQSRSAS